MKLSEILGQDVFNTLSEEKKAELKDKDFLLNDGNFIPKERFDEVNKDKNEYKKQLSDLKGKFKDNEELQNKIAELEKSNTDREEAYNKKIKELAFNSAFETELKGLKAKDSNLIKSLLDQSKITIDGDKVTGLSEQIQAIKKERDYLFEAEVGGTGSFGTGGGKGNPTPPSLGEKFAKKKIENMSNESLNNFFK